MSRKADDNPIILALASEIESLLFHFEENLDCSSQIVDLPQWWLTAIMNQHVQYTSVSITGTRERSIAEVLEDC